ncbi:phosphatase PAP2 family protein [Kiloniella sp.]|uniref:phosphatase PAP2 family protein n=1 Tax=Kiloniella sp. TaxID=1938587 RepID=UPI003B017C3D
MVSAKKDISSWNFKKLVIWNVVFIAIILSTIGNDFKTPWDDTIFFALNGSLQEGRGIWNGYWSITNSRLFDTFCAVFLGAVCLFYLIKNRENDLAERFSRVMLLVISVVLIMVLISRGFEHYYHQSPSQVLKPFVNINDLVSWLEVKTGTRKSFPSDHAAISFVTAILSWRYFGRKYGILLSVFALINATPRMVGGGHWFGDVWIGGMLLACIIAIWIIYSPLLHWVRRGVLKLFQLKIIKKFTANLS